MNESDAEFQDIILKFMEATGESAVSGITDTLVEHGLGDPSPLSRADARRILARGCVWIRKHSRTHGEESPWGPFGGAEHALVAELIESLVPGFPSELSATQFRSIQLAVLEAVLEVLSGLVQVDLDVARRELMRRAAGRAAGHPPDNE